MSLALLQNPDQAAVIRDADDPKIVASAVEELLRYLSIIQNGQRRVAVEDIHIAGETIRAGEGIIIDLAPANWDPDAFAEPDRLYLHRSGADRNVAFGYGRHQCVGQQLARAELQIVYRTLFRRIPTLRTRRPDRGHPVQARPARLRRLRTPRDLVSLRQLLSKTSIRMEGQP